MSTPVFETAKLAPKEDMSARMKTLIDLQNEEIRMSRTEKKDDAFFETPSRRGEPPETTVPISGEDTNSLSSMGGKSLSRSVRLSSLHAFNDPEEQPLQGGPVDVLVQNKANDTSLGIHDVFQDGEPGVGRGTLLFNHEKLGSATASQLSRGNQPHTALMHDSPGLGYGSVEAPAPPPASLQVNPHQNQRHQYEGRAYPGQTNYQHHGSRPHHAEHMPMKNRENFHEQSTLDSILETPKLICHCLGTLLCTFFCCCATDVEQLQRSFCYGAIDGMLTGSGIVAAFCGMNILAPTSTITIRSFVVAFSASACFADSLCMALGHVWTTHVLVSAQARERTTTRASVDKNKADAKGRLVDMLLEKGMLKIDAMSLVDTLEGYPDMFVSALVGDALIAGGVGGSTDSSTDLSARHRSMSGGRMSPSGSHGWGGHHWGGRDEYSHHMAEHDTGGHGNFLQWKFPSYGQHMDELDQEIDPEAAVVRAAMTESRREGFFMMLGFSIFAVVPSLIYLVCPIIMKTQQHIKVASHSGIELAAEAGTISGGGTSATSVAVTAAAAIMWFLGVWKSRFMDSNYMLFGIETVVVQLVCIAAAYGVGTFIRACFPEFDAIIGGTTTSDIPVDGS